MKPDYTNDQGSITSEPVGSVFVPFDRSAIWDYQHERLADYDPRTEAADQAEVATPTLARAQAETICAVWRDALDAGRLDPNEPLVILELMAGNGRYAASTLSAIHESIADTPLSEFSILYLLSDPRPERLSACWNHPALWAWLENGQLDTVCFDPERDRHLDVKSRRLVFGPQSLANPFTVIANGVFSALPQSLYHAHFGRCNDGFVNVVVRDDTQFDPDSGGPVMQMDYEWREAVAEQPYQALLDSYVRDLDSTPLLLPSTAMACLDRLSELCCDSMTVLSADRGYCTDQQLRAQSVPEFAALGRYFLPVNGHVLARYAESQNGASLQAQTYDNSVLHSVLSLGGPGAFGPQARMAFQQNFVSRSPDDHRVLRFGLEEQLAQLTPAQMLSHLRLSAWDSRILAVCLPALLATPLDLTPAERLQWIETLQRIWQSYYAVGDDADFVCNVASLAMQLGAWGLGRRCIESLNGALDNDPISQYNLALCCLHTEDIEDAVCAIGKTISLEPNADPALSLSIDIYNWIGYRETLNWYDPALCHDAELSIHPLGAHHASAALYQLRDPNIIVQTCLPAWKDESEFADWLATKKDTDNEACCAVIHKTHGFIGMVDLRWDGDKAFFYFWIGADHQNQGYGPRAARLLFNLAEEQLGITKIYTTAFRDNYRSEHALLSLGFTSLPFEAKEPDQDAALFRRGPKEKSAGNCYDELVALLHAIDSPIVVLRHSLCRDQES